MSATIDSTDYKRLAAGARIGVLVSYFGMLLVFSLTTMVLPSCQRSPNWVIWLIHLLPLLMLVRGVMNRNVRSHVWLSFLSLGYFMASVNGIFACPTFLTGLEIVLEVMLFVTTTMYIRWRSRELKAASVLASESV
jgi:uncharacterized membrane protein